MSPTVDQYGLIGHPVAHSLSPFIHSLFARQTGQSMTYRLYDVEPENFRARVMELAAEGVRGLNVTVPHKVAAAQLCSELSARAQRAGAVNTLTFNEDGRITGDNTDGAGLIRDLRDNHGIALQGRHILIIGAGGAARGVLAPLLALAPARVVVANRTAEKAWALAADFADLGSVQGCGFEELTTPFDLVINATSASLSGQTPAVSPAVIGPGAVCYDMAYGKQDTPFMLWAKAHGCGTALQGWGMLVEQAAESFCIWRGVRPDTAPVLAALESR